ncbi:hypothetical protein ACKI1Q_40910 [Streptomyces galilaeus]|uniref:hypothetical protein n=1 Tax=Streptomyces TaxID=1883 RepID=UPI003804A8E4
MRARLPKGLLCSLRLDTPDPWRGLEHARWLRIGAAGTANEVVAELLDAALLSQAPAGPGRAQAADWALRAATAPTAGATAGPLLQLTSLYLTANADPDTGTGLAEPDQMARACGTHPTHLPDALDQLTARGLLSSWHACRD